MVASIKLGFQEYLRGRQELIEKRLSSYLGADDPPRLWEAMRYSVLAGGKRLRALLCLASAEAVGGAQALDLALPCACAIEMVHAFSLIHDDLPAMDNDDFRRGRPTNHKVFGEDMAILAGDALLALAFEILVNQTPQAVPPATLLEAAGALAAATGSTGMVGGQVADMTLTGLTGDASKSIDLETLETMHRRKTGALLRFSTWSGAKLAGASTEQLAALSQFGDILGLAFQIADDLLDVTGDRKTLGKTPGKDEASGKVTWVRVFGVEESRRRLSELEDEGKQALLATGIDRSSLNALESLLDYAVHRSN